MQKLTGAILLASIVAIVGSASFATAADNEGFKSIFDGKTLNNWDGNPKFWRVEEGSLVGETTPDNPTQGNTFIIWRGGETADFELKLEYKIESGNSGIQYRSFEVPNEKWVVGGYQADMEAGDTWSGIMYGERYRGILAKRGDKTVIGDDHKPEVVGSVGDPNEIGSKIKKNDWNEYHIIAKGYHFIHKINGVTTCEVTDEDKEMRRASGILALQLHAGPPMKVHFRNIRLKQLEPEDKAASADDAQGKKIVFVAGRPSHGPGAHEHNAGCLLLAKELKRAMPGYEVKVHQNGWPSDGTIFEGADAIVMYSDGGSGHMVIPNLAQVDELAKKGVGIACLHYAVEVPKGEPGNKFLDWIGGYFETHWSVNPHWEADFSKLPEHPVTRGVKPFKILDEWYYHMRFREGMEGVTPILSALPPQSTLTRPDGPHSGNPHVRQAVGNGEAQHVAWVSERPDGGRGFGFTGGHFHWNWGDDNFRKLVLNAIVWTAKGEVPAHGVTLAPVTRDDLEKNQDHLPKSSQTKPEPKHAPKQAATGGQKPAFLSPVISVKTPGHAVEVDVDITGAKELYLIVTDAGDGISADWANWAEPRLEGPEGKKKSSLN